MTKKKTKIYFEPMDYFPEEVRKEFKLGEYSETNGDPELIKDTMIKEKDESAYYGSIDISQFIKEKDLKKPVKKKATPKKKVNDPLRKEGSRTVY
ncbi:MAG: hypothetical protein K6G27_14115 [Lachnospiraceae bacterium]|nr:hypothetical protein [Lachnospiraceae bacterium]